MSEDKKIIEKHKTGHGRCLEGAQVEIVGRIEDYAWVCGKWERP